MADGQRLLAIGVLCCAGLCVGLVAGQNCSAFGNMHVLTFDGKDLNFQYPCKYSLARTCSKLAPVSVDIRVKTTTLNDRGAIGLQYVEIIAEGQSIQLYPNGSIYNSGVLVEAYNYKCRLIVQRGPIGIEATIVGANMSVVVNDYGLVLVRASTKLRTFLCGLCGNFDGDPANDRIVTSSYSDWFVPDTSDRSCASLPQVDIGSVAARIQSCSGRYDMQGRHTCEWFNRTTTSQFQVCATSSRQLATFFYGFCVYDMCLAGTLDEEGSGFAAYGSTGRSRLDEAVVCRVADAFALQCYARGQPPYGWRDGTACAKTCPRGSAYSPNATVCAAAACSASPDGACNGPPTACSAAGYTEGCACPPSTQWGGSGCQPKGACGCAYSGAYYSNGTSWLDNSCSTTIQCTNGKLSYTPLSCATKSKCLLIAGAMQCVCPEGYSGDGRRQCTYVCDPGRYVSPSNDGCVDCPVGTYKPGKSSARACVACPNGQTTSGPASVNATQCSDTKLLPYRNAAVMCRTYDCLKRVYPPANVIKNGVPFGSKNYGTIAVSSNGLITFGADFIGRTPGNFKYATNGIPALAPLWLRQDFRRFPLATVTVGDYSIRDSQTDVLQAVNKLLSSSRQVDNSFSAIWAVVVTWQNSAPLKQLQTQLSQNATYQAVVATDGLTTYAAYIYPSGGLNLANDAAANAYMGYTSGETQNVLLYNFYGSGTALMGRLDEISSNTGSSGTWIFKVSTGKSSPQQRDCLQWYAQQASIWTLSKPTANKCPCNYAIALSDPGYRMNQGSRCATSIFPDKLYSFYQTCCYDSSPKGRGKLLTGATDPGGPTQYSPYSATTLQAYNINDKKPFMDCCTLSKNCNLYRQYRPASSCRNYVSPKSGAGRGDPHFRTIDGLYYTYNGVGEFHLLRSQTMSIQIRLGTTAGQPQASEIKAITSQARRPDSSCVHVEVNPYKTGIFAVIKSPSPGADDLKVDVMTSANKELAYNHVIVYTRAGVVRAAFDNGFTIDIGLTAGMMQYTLYVPSNGYASNTSGLLGKFDGSVENDLMLPNGTILRCPEGLNDSRCIFNDFGPAWRITQSDSIFWYAPGFTTASYTDLRFVPIFMEGKPTRPQDVDFCKGNKECIYDLMATGNRTVAATTLALYDNDKSTVESLGVMVPAIRVDRTFLKAVVGLFISFTVDVLPGSNGSASLVILDLPNGAQLNKVSEYSYYFSWMPQDVSTSSSIRLVAFDAGNMSSGPVLIKVALCPGCGTNGTCMWPAEDDFDDSTIVACNCTIGWRGSSCDLDADSCVDSPCDYGTCVDLPPGEHQEHACICNDGFQLIHDSTSEICIDIDECSNQLTNKCQQLCNNTIGSYMCACAHGFQLEPDGLSCKPAQHSGLMKRAAKENTPEVDECSVGSPCGNGGTCLNTTGSYTCTCGVGYVEASGNASCQACQLGRYGQDCANQCDCAARAASCDHVLGCTECNDGWTGYQCRDDVNECERFHTCGGNNTVCVNTPGSYRCECLSGYKETNDSNCVDINECLETLQPCPGGGFACSNTDGAFTCICPAGYFLIDTQCIDVNECVGDPQCDVNSECLNTVGSYTCQCKDGFIGDGRDVNTGGRGCTDVDECLEQTDVCPARSICTNTAGSYECSCDPGHIPAGQCCVDINIEWIHSSACSEVTVCCNANGQYSSYCTADFEAATAAQYSCTTLTVSVALASPLFAGTTKAQSTPNSTDLGSIGNARESSLIIPETSPLPQGAEIVQDVTQPTPKIVQGQVIGASLGQFDHSPSLEKFIHATNIVTEKSEVAHTTPDDSYSNDADGMDSETVYEEQQSTKGPMGHHQDSTLTDVTQSGVRSIRLMHEVLVEVTGESTLTSISMTLNRALESFYRPLLGFLAIRDLKTPLTTYDSSRLVREGENTIQVDYTCVFAGMLKERDDSYLLMQISAYVAALNATLTMDTWRFVITGKINYIDNDGSSTEVDCDICDGGDCQLKLERFPVCECCLKSWTSCAELCSLEHVAIAGGLSLSHAMIAAAASTAVIVGVIAAMAFVVRRKAKCSGSKPGAHGFSRSISTECTQPLNIVSTKPKTT